MSSTEKCCSKFQSTFPQGERQVLASAYANVVDISIHVPTRGTTVITISEILIPNEFQSTFPQGERRFATSGPYSFGAFQSTFPQGERQTMVLHAGKVPYFNPRSHKGNDLKVKTSTRSQEFQSTFPRERPDPSTRFQTLYYFNPRSHKGNDSKNAHFHCTFSQQLLHNIHNFSSIL